MGENDAFFSGLLTIKFFNDIIIMRAFGLIGITMPISGSLKFV